MLKLSYDFKMKSTNIGMQQKKKKKQQYFLTLSNNREKKNVVASWVARFFFFLFSLNKIFLKKLKKKRGDEDYDTLIFGITKRKRT